MHDEVVRVPDQCCGLAGRSRWAAAQQLAVWVVGRGSNSLFDDRGFDGLVVVNEMDFVEDLGGGLFRCVTSRVRISWLALEAPPPPPCRPASESRPTEPCLA